MLQIKTIIYDFIQDSAFDNKVNEALAEGWELKRRDLVPRPNSGFILYAELERETEEEDDRLCETCAHQFKEPQEQPCIECDGDCSRWEPKNLEKPQKPQKAEELEEEEICEACMIHYDDEPKDEEAKAEEASEQNACFGCKHAKKLPATEPCLSCYDSSKREPEEGKRCTNCKYEHLKGGDEPCINCLGYITDHSKWEPIA